MFKSHKYNVKIKLLEPMLGTVPYNREIYKKYGKPISQLKSGVDVAENDKSNVYADKLPLLLLLTLPL